MKTKAKPAWPGEGVQDLRETAARANALLARVDGILDEVLSGGYQVDIKADVLGMPLEFHINLSKRVAARARKARK